jgi:hypothetical protein
VSFGDDDMKYSTTPELLKTVAAIAVPTASASPTANGTTTASKTGPAVATFTGAGSNVFPYNCHGSFLNMYSDQKQIVREVVLTVQEDFISYRRVVISGSTYNSMQKI